MSRHTDHLDAARQALLTANPALCATEIAAFEDLCAKQPPDDDQILACRGKLQALSALAVACAEGVAAAAHGLRDALDAAGRLTTYDSAGSRATRDTRNHTPRRY